MLRKLKTSSGGAVKGFLFLGSISKTVFVQFRTVSQSLQQMLAKAKFNNTLMCSIFSVFTPPHHTDQQVHLEALARY